MVSYHISPSKKHFMADNSRTMDGTGKEYTLPLHEYLEMISIPS